MRVTIRLFARLRDIAGASDFERDVPAGSTASTVWIRLAREFPDFNAYTDAVSTAVNEEYAKMDSTLSEGDEVAFLPPVSGG